MASNVVYPHFITKLDLPADRILEKAQGQLDGCVVIGYTRDGDEYFASSYADGATINWLLDRCKRLLLNPEE
jgi:hypothetical protein